MEGSRTIQQAPQEPYNPNYPPKARTDPIAHCLCNAHAASELYARYCVIVVDAGRLARTLHQVLLTYIHR